MQNPDGFSPLGCIRRSAKQPNKGKKKITDKRHRLKKKRERQASLGLISLMVPILKNLLRKCPSCLTNLPSMLLDEAAFCTNDSNQLSQQYEAQKQKSKEVSKLLEKGLLKFAQTNDEYINPNTLVGLLSYLMSQPTLDSHIQRQGHSSSSVGTMIPTPGMSHSGNFNLMATSEDVTMICGSDSIPARVNTGTMLPICGVDGTLCNGYDNQPPATFAINSVGTMPSMGVQRTTMIPIPGFDNNNNSLSLE